MSTTSVLAGPCSALRKKSAAQKEAIATHRAAGW